eukprot:6192669-Amphidinium_carterae.2
MCDQEEVLYVLGRSAPIPRPEHALESVARCEALDVLPEWLRRQVNIAGMHTTKDVMWYTLKVLQPSPDFLRISIPMLMIPRFAMAWTIASLSALGSVAGVPRNFLLVMNQQTYTSVALLTVNMLCVLNMHIQWELEFQETDSAQFHRWGRISNRFPANVNIFQGVEESFLAPLPGVPIDPEDDVHVYVISSDVLTGQDPEGRTLIPPIPLDTGLRKWTHLLPLWR